MKKKLSIILLVIVAAFAMLAFSACDSDDLHGTYEDAESRMILILEEKQAHFGSLDTMKTYFVNYVDYGKKSVGINTVEWDCYWGTFQYEFINNGNDTLTLKGYIASEGEAFGSDTPVDIVLIKQ